MNIDPAKYWDTNRIDVDDFEKMMVMVMVSSDDDDGGGDEMNIDLVQDAVGSPTL